MHTSKNLEKRTRFSLHHKNREKACQYIFYSYKTRRKRLFVNFFDLGHCRIPWLLFVCLFALMPSRRKKSGYPFILEFFTRLSWYWCQHPLPGPGVPELNQPWWILGTEAIFLPLRLVQLEHHITAVCWYHWCKEPTWFVRGPYNNYTTPRTNPLQK